MHSEWHFCSYLSYYAGNLAIMKLALQLRMFETCSIFIFMYHSDILLPLLQQMYTLQVALDKSVCQMPSM